MALILGEIEGLPELKPCPFCGGRPRIAWSSAFTLMILCPVCYCRSQPIDHLPWDADPMDSEQVLAETAILKATAKWNRRVEHE